MYRILVADGMNNDQIENLRNLGFDVIDKFYDGEELGLMCQDVDALVIRSKNTITKEIILERLIRFKNRVDELGGTTSTIVCNEAM